MGSAADLCRQVEREGKRKDAEACIFNGQVQRVCVRESECVRKMEESWFIADRKQHGSEAQQA